MANKILTSLSRFELTPQEELSGKILSVDNCYMLQNLLADYSEERISLRYDPEHPLKFMQEESALLGQIVLLKFLLQQTTDASQEQFHVIQSQSHSQSQE